MLEVKFLDLIKDKKFGTINLGDSKEKVMECLGTPDRYSSPDHNPTVFDAIRYGNWEFNFIKNKLHSISNTFIGNKRFDPDFHYKNDKFVVTSWFKKAWIDTKLKNFKKKLDEENIQYVEDVFYDAIRIRIDKYIDIMFSSEFAYHKDLEEWTKIDPKILNLKLFYFYLISEQ
jgi:hypothetical protein